MDDPLPERCEKFVAAAKVRHLDERAADLGGAVRIAAGCPDQIVLGGVRGGAAVLQPERLARVEDLDGIDRRAQSIEARSPHVIAPVDAERMRDDDDPALVVDARDGLLARSVAGHRTF